MKSERPGIFYLLENFIDIVLNFAIMIASYMLTVVVMNNAALNIFEYTVILPMFVSVLLLSFIYQAFNIYRPVPHVRVSHFIHHIIRANCVFFSVAVILNSIILEGEERKFVFVWIAIFTVISTAFLLLKKRIIVNIILAWRKNQFKLQKVIIVGDNVTTAKEYINQISETPDNGIEVIGAVGRKMSSDVGCERLGDFEDLEAVLDEHRPDFVVFAIDSYDKKSLIKLVNMCDDRCIKVYFLPVIYGFLKTARQIERVGYMPIINIHSTPLDNPANAFVKRAMDIAGSLALILVTLPIMIFAAVGVFISSPGPVFFKQRRVGKMGKIFTMYKFRSMRLNKESTKAWSHKGDPRKTKFGAFIRSTAIDELPQLFNVLLGDMSLVGPRPEIPHFVEEFKQIIPLYMVKHYVKPGMTGLAQVKGLRGDTSVEKRIREDIEYIENWTLGMDLAILFATPFKAFNKNEMYTVPTEESSDEPEGEAESGGAENNGKEKSEAENNE